MMAASQRPLLLCPKLYDGSKPTLRKCAGHFTHRVFDSFKKRSFDFFNNFKELVLTFLIMQQVIVSREPWSLQRIAILGMWWKSSGDLQGIRNKSGGNFGILPPGTQSAVHSSWGL